MLIAIEGVIGNGKSTTATLVAERLAYALVLETVPSGEVLGPFYADPGRYAAQTELAFLQARADQLRHLPAGDVVADFSPAKNLVFGRVNLTGRDLDLFEERYQGLIGAMAKPALCVFLDLPIDALLARIRQRGRPFERTIEPGYLGRLRESYLANLDQLADRVEVIALDPQTDEEQVGREVIDRLPHGLRSSAP